MTALEMIQKSTYGAVELKEFIRKYTYRSFLITTAGLVLIFGSYTLANALSDNKDSSLKAPLAKFNATLEILQASESQVEAPVEVQVVQQINTGPAARAGSPTPVPTAEITIEMQDFADMTELNRASSEGGTGEDLGGMSDAINWGEDINVSVDTKVEDEDPDMNEFIPVEEFAATDMTALQRSVVYPEIAKQAGIEGRVTIKVLVDKTGRVKKMAVIQSDSEMLEEAAMDAIKKATFTPGIQNGKAITHWVAIPIIFKLQ